MFWLCRYQFGFGDAVVLFANVSRHCQGFVGESIYGMVRALWAGFAKTFLGTNLDPLTY